MNKATLYEYVLLWHPTENQAKEGKKSILICDPTAVLALTSEAASIVAAREIPDIYKDQLEQVEIVIRPF